jgi:hypothetical protein
MSDKDLSSAQPMPEKKAFCEKDNRSRVIDVESTITISSLLLLWTMVFVAVIWHVLTNTAQVADAFMHITNETSRLAEERWTREGGPSPEDRWRQEEAATRRAEERIRSLFAFPEHVEFSAPATFSRPAARFGYTQLKIDGMRAKQNIADRKRVEDMFAGKDEQIDLNIQRGIENLAEQYAIESKTLKAHLVAMVKLYRVADATIGFAGIWLVISLGGLAICEVIRWLSVGLCRRVVNHIV